MVELFTNSGDPDQMLHSAASDLGLHCLSVTRTALEWPVINYWGTGGGVVGSLS